MKKIYDLNHYIQNVTTGGFTNAGMIFYTRENSNQIEQCDKKQLTKCIASYFHILEHYPELQNVELDTNIYNSLRKDLEKYQKNHFTNTILDDKLKEKLDLCNKEELNFEFQKYFQNLLTNKEVLRYIKEMIDKKDYYFYDKYANYSKEQCEEEIKTLKHLFRLLENIEFIENPLGIQEKYISFEPGSYEYENITPFICFDIYDLNHYKKILKFLENKLKENHF